MLRRLAWSSIPSPSLSAAHLDDIGARARRDNERNHVSGMLLFTGAHFLAILEGHEWDLQKLWLRLEQDRRHDALIRIGNDRCGNRWFPQWKMAYADHALVASRIEELRSGSARISTKWAQMIHPIMFNLTNIDRAQVATLT